MTGGGRRGSLILSAEEQARLLRDLSRVPWLRATYEGFRERVDRFRSNPRIYINKGLAFFDSCPDCNTRLVFDPFQPHEHRCPKCGKNAQGRHYDGAWYRQHHEWVAETLILAGILYRLDGRREDAELVRQVLLQYADHYEEFPLCDNELGPTRIFQSTYMEALWLANLIAACDLIHPSGVLSAEDEGRLRERLFYPSAAIVRSFNEGMSNRQAFNNVGLGAVALYFDDEEMLGDVLSGPTGFAFHMRESVREDGLWYEGETYHFATLYHLLTLAEMCRHAGIDLYQDGPYGSLRPLFDAPLRLMYPDLTFPSRKDSWFGRGIDYHKEIYEIGYARYGDRRYGGLLARAYRQGADRRTLGWRGFLYARPDLPSLPDEELVPRSSVLSAGTGLAVLRNEDGARYLSVEYGHYGGGHGHPDRLHINYYAAGRLWLGDPGTGWYHVPELAWYRSTLAHNTVLVDGVSQRPNSEGRVLAFVDLPCLQAVQVEVGTAYRGVTMRRTLCLIGDYYLDRFDLASGEPRVYDWVYQSRGALVVDCPLEPAPPPGEGDGYAFLTAVHAGRADAEVEAAFVDGRERLVLRVAGEVGTEVYTARAPGIPLQEERPMHVLLLRRRAARTAFLALARAGADTDPVPLWSREENGWVRVRGEGWRDAVWIGPGAGEMAYVRESERGDGVRIAWVGLSEVVDGERVWVRCAFPLTAAEARVQGEEVHLQLPQGFGRVMVYAPVARTVRVNGSPVAFDREGDFVSVTQPEPVALVPLWRDGQAVYAGIDNDLQLAVYRYGTGPDLEEAPLPRAEVPGGCSVSIRPSRGPGDEAELYVLRLSPAAGVSDQELLLTLELGGVQRRSALRIEPPVEVSLSLEAPAGSPHLVCNVRNRAPFPLDVDLAADLPDGFGPAGETRWAGRVEGNSGHRFAVPFLFEHRGDRYPARLTVRCGDYVQEHAREFHVAEARWLEGRPAWEEAVGRVTALSPPLRLDREDQASFTERPWGGPADLSAEARAAWDEQGLWLICRVWDDRVVFDPGVQDPFHNDGIQVYFDFRPSGRREDGNYTPGLAAYLVTALSERGPEPAIYEIAGNREISNRKARPGWFTREGVRGTTEILPDGYRLVLRFPYRSLGVDPPRCGDVIGFDLALNDNDGTRTRRTQMAWAGATRPRAWLLGTYRHPARFGRLIFTGRARP